MSKLLATIATAIIIALIAGLAAPHVIDWNDYREVFETQASRLMGRPVRVRGDVGLNLLPTPEIRFERVEIAGGDGRFAEPFAQARAFKMVLSLGQLLSGAIESKRVELVDPVFRLKVDEAGRSNWGNLGASDLSQALLLAPREISLRDVEITGGVVELHTPYDLEPLRFENISGQFDANALSGPYRFAGRAAFRGRKFDLRLSSGRYENAAIKLKLSARDGVAGEDYQFDGALSGLSGPLTWKGTASLRVGSGVAGRAGRARMAGGRDAAEALEIKGKALLALDAARLDDLAVTVVQEERPQSFTGSVRAEWGMRSRLDMTLDARVLDLDALAARAGLLSVGAAGAVAPFDVAAALAPRLLGALPFTPREGSLRLAAGQLWTRGDVIENLELELIRETSRVGGRWRVGAARATLPGESHVSLSGALDDAVGGWRFAGAVETAGASLARLLRWLSPDNAWAGGEPQRFALRGRLNAGPGGGSLDDASGELADSAFKGSLRYERPAAGSAAGRLALVAQANRLDLRPLFGDGRGVAALMEGETAVTERGSVDAAGEASEKEPPTAAPPGAEEPATATPERGRVGRGRGLWDAFTAVVAANDSDIDLNADELFLPGFEGRAVAAKLRVRDGSLDIAKFNMAGEGLAVKAEGRLERYRESPEGSLRLTVDAGKAQALRTLAALLGAPEALAADGRRLEALAPLRLEGSFAAGRGAGQAELKLAGAAGASAFSATARITGEASRLWEGEINASATVNNPAGAALLRQAALAGGAREPGRAEGGGAGPGAMGAGSLTLRAQGSLKGLVDVGAELRTPLLEARFSGRAAAATKPWTLDGRVALKARNAAELLALVDLAPADAPVQGGSPGGSLGGLELNAAMSRSGGRYVFSSASLRLDGGRVEGRASLDLEGDRPVVTATATSDEASLPRLLGLFVESGGTPAAAAPGGAVWPDRPFAFRTFDGFEGSLSLKAQAVELGGGVRLEDAQMEARLEQGALRLGRVSGRLWGGRFRAEGALASRPAVGLARRVGLTAALALDHADLRKLPVAAGASPLARGSADLQLSLAGEGVSPHGLLAGLSGEGSVRLGGGALYGLAPQAIGRAAKTFVSASRKPDGGSGRLLGEEFRGGVFPYRAAGAALKVDNGVLHVAPVLLRSTRGAARVSALLDLTSLALDSEWELRAPLLRAVRKGDGRPSYRQETKPEFWPPLRLSLAGPLARLGLLPLQFEAEDFERALMLRRMERDVERLENLAPPPEPAAQPAGEVAAEPGSTGAILTAPSGAAMAAPPAPVSGAAGGWRAETENAPASRMAPAEGQVAPAEGPAAGAGAPGGATEGQRGAPPAPGGRDSGESFEKRIQGAIGQPEASTWTGRVEPGGEGAEAKKPSTEKSGGDLFDWLR